MYKENNILSKMITLERYVDIEKRKPITDRNIRELIGGPVKIRNVSGLSDSDSLPSLCPKVGSGLVLFWQSKTGKVGHWNLVLRHSDHYEFFDSYGLLPLQVANKTTHDGGVRCMKLLRGHNVKYGRYAFQKRSDDVQTCGRFVAFRYNCHAFNYEEFKKLLQYRGVAPDDLITLLTIHVDFSHINKKKLE